MTIGYTSYNTYDNVNFKRNNAQDNAGKMAAGGAVGTATFATLKKSSQIGQKTIKLVNDSKIIKATNKAKIINIFKNSRMFNNPVIKKFIPKIAGPLAGFAALSTVVGSAAKIADTCNYVQGNKE